MVIFPGGNPGARRDVYVALRPAAAFGDEPAREPAEAKIRVWIADKEGVRLQPDSADGTTTLQDSSNPAARYIIFHPDDTGAPPPKARIDLVPEFERVIHALNHLYPQGEPASERKFRLLYRTVFGLAHLALEKEGGFDVDTARRDLERIRKDIIEDEGPRVKNRNIKEQLKWAAWIAVPALATYVLLCEVADDSGIVRWLHRLGADRVAVANFMLLWIGCCLGVCLSYALRKTEFTLDDMVTPESDFLTPAIRVALTGTLAMLFVLFSMLKIVDFAIAGHQLSHVANAEQQTLAFVVGVIFGIGEQLLPATMLARTKGLIPAK